MTKKEFISWITDLGFIKTWNSKNEYSIFPGKGMQGIFSEKLYFTVEESSYYVDDFDIRIYFSKFTGGMSYGSNLGYFPLSSIGEFEKDIILSVLLKNCDEIPLGIKKYLRDSKIKNILED